MSRIISRAEAWERAYDVFQEVNFNAFDYNSIKQSLIDYMKLYFPEDFNDFIESSEFVAIMELFAYVGELLSYRLDLNAHENFITQAQRKESVLRLAKLISYTAARNIPARGLTKMTSIQTTEAVYDSNSVNLANTKINWNDTNNSNWKEQFVLILNRVLRQSFGSVSPTERVQVDDVIFELYQLNNNPITNGVFPYTANVSGKSYPMELVPSSLDSNGPLERRPDNTSAFSILYGSDGLGDGSDTTGFFFFTKQGSLANLTTTFDGVTPNQTFDITVNNINDADVWFNNIDPDTGETIDDGTVADGVSGEWQEVDLANAQNIIFNTNSRRQKYEIETLANDQIRLVFGDGEFSDIPSGTFQAWYRTSANEDLVIPQNTVVNKTSSFTYVDISGNVQTLTFTFSLINSLQNASPSEDIDHIRRVAPSVYYTQDRMVNARDYNVFMLQDPSILKLRAVNRTFAGDSAYLAWHDPTTTYESAKLIGVDGALYVDQRTNTVQTATTDLTELVDSYIQPILSTTDFFTILESHNPAVPLRKTFTPTQRTNLIDTLQDIVDGIQFSPLYIYVDGTTFDWEFVSGGGSVSVSPPGLTDPLMDFDTPIIEVVYDPGASNGLIWTVNYQGERYIIQSNGTRFWNVNQGSVIDYDTLNTVSDTITLLRANLDDTWQGILTQDWAFDVVGQELNVDQTTDINRLNVLPVDVNGDNIPDNMSLDYLFDGDLTLTVSAGQVQLPFTVLYNDFVGTGSPTSALLSVLGDVSGPMQIGVDFTLLEPDGTTAISGESGSILSVPADATIVLSNKDFVYFTRADSSSDWELAAPASTTVINGWYTETATAGTYPDNWDNTSAVYRRLRGRTDYNFSWFHSAERFSLIDPSQSNIIDMFVIPRGYYTELTEWLSGETSVEPDAPTPLDLRTTYGYLLDSKMISDTVVLHPGQFKILFGSKAPSGLRATFKVIRSSTAKLTDNEVKTRIVGVVEEFFDINLWEFGETFYFTELAAAVHDNLKSEIDSIVIVPLSAGNQFGDMFEVVAREDEILQADIGVEDIEVVTSYTSQNLRQDI